MLGLKISWLTSSPNLWEEQELREALGVVKVQQA
jgi:hypothetical protein